DQDGSSAFCRRTPSGHIESERQDQHSTAEYGDEAASSVHQAVQPPSTRRLEPVTRLAAGEARNTTAFATSSTVPMRPSGIRSITHRRNSGFAKKGSVNGVVMKVGAIDTTRTPFGG